MNTFLLITRFFSPARLRGGLALILCFAASHGRAALIIDVGSVGLQPNAANQSVVFSIRNDDVVGIDVAGLSFNIQVADGGPGAGGSVLGPHITGVNILTGTSFAANNTGQTDVGSVPQFANWTTTTSAGHVTLAGLSSITLASVTFDTTGFSDPQSWDLWLGGTLNGPTIYFAEGGGQIVPTINDGSIAVVPEPRQAGVMAALFILSAVVFQQWRARRISRPKSP